MTEAFRARSIRDWRFRLTEGGANFALPSAGTLYTVVQRLFVVHTWTSSVEINRGSERRKQKRDCFARVVTIKKN